MIFITRLVKKYYNVSHLFYKIFEVCMFFFFEIIWSKTVSCMLSCIFLEICNCKKKFFKFKKNTKA